MTRARNTADTQTASGGPVPPFAAGKNAIINGDFSVWQRGTSFASPATAAFTSDRWSVVYDGTGATRTISQQTFTPGTAPVAGYEGRFFYRFAQSVAGSGGSYNLFQNRMEQVQTFAGQTVTISFWGKAAANTSLVKLNLEQEFGTGGSPSAAVSTDIASTNFALTTSWQRFTVTTTVPSISGKTIGTTTPGYLGLRFWIPVNSTFTIDIWGVQVEAGSTATPFETATGTIQGELAACQRYLPAFKYDASGSVIGAGYAYSTNNAQMICPFPVSARVAPTGITVSNVTHVTWNSTGNAASTNITFNSASTLSGGVLVAATATSGFGGVGTFNNASGSILFTGCEL
jgi:hypothetical protein